MASTIKVDKIEGSTGSTITVPTGQTLTVTDGLAIANLPTVTVAKGGTNLTSFTAGDVLYATGSTTLAKLAKGTAEQVLAMNSGATAPDWGSVDLTVLPTITVAKGGTNIASFTAGDILYATGSTTLAKLAKGTASQHLLMNAGATAPEWATVAAGGSTPAYWLEVTADTSSLNSYVWYTIGGASIAATERFDTDTAVASGIFTVPADKAGTYKFGIMSTSTGSSTHGSSDGVLHRIQKSTDSGSSWASINNQEVKALWIYHPGQETSNANSEHYAESLSVGDQIRLQAYIYKGGATNVVFKAGQTTGGATGSGCGTFVYGFKLF